MRMICCFNPCRCHLRSSFTFSARSLPKRPKGGILAPPVPTWSLAVGICQDRHCDCASLTPSGLGAEGRETWDSRTNVVWQKVGRMDSLAPRQLARLLVRTGW